MPAILAAAVKHLIKAFIADPKGVLKAIFWILVFPIILISTIVVAPLGIFSHIPMVQTGQHQDYIDVINDIEVETGVLIDFNHLVGVHAVLFEQNFDQVTKRDIEDLAWNFIHEYEDERTRTVSDTCSDIDDEGVITYSDCSYTETYYVTMYELINFDTVLNNLVSQDILESEEVKHVYRYIQFVGMDETEVDMDALPIITDGVFMRPATGTITSGYGQRWGRQHSGIDIGSGGRSGVPIVAAADGVVRKSYTSTSYGETIMIAHNINGTMWESVYAHMVTGSRRHRAGESVKKGDVIGIMGTTGNSTGVHLHFELNKNGLWNANRTNVVNPIHYIQF